MGFDVETAAAKLYEAHWRETYGDDGGDWRAEMDEARLREAESAREREAGLRKVREAFQAFADAEADRDAVLHSGGTRAALETLNADDARALRSAIDAPMEAARDAWRDALVDWFGEDDDRVALIDGREFILRDGELEELEPGSVAEF